MDPTKTAFINGKIYTMDDQCTVSEAIVIEHGKITYVGSSEGARRYYDASFMVVDLLGRCVLPGFIEPHVHVPGNAYNILYNINLFDVKDEKETMDTIKDFIKSHPEREMYYGRGFTPQVFKGIESSLGPKKERLDEICPDKPVILIDFGGHIAWLNSKALQKFGIDGHTPDVPGGVIERDPETGELWGTLKDEAKCLYPDQEFSLDEKKTAVEWMQKQLNAYGYTSAFALRPSACSQPSPIFDAMESLEKEEKLTMRFVCGREIKANLPAEEQILEAAYFTNKYNSDFVRAKTAKFFVDGTLDGVSAYLSEPYEKAAGKGEAYCGEPLWNREELTAAFIKVLQSNMNVHIHAIGDEAVSMSIDALEAAQMEVPGDHRNTITHLQLVKQEDIIRMAKLGIIACCNVHWHIKDPCLYFNGELPFLGKERAEKEYPLASFIKEGVIVTSSGDVPITAYPNPFYAIQAGVTRNMFNAGFYNADPITDMDDPQWLLGKEERVSVLDMVRAYTCNSAYASYAEDKIGTLEIGKYGDLIVIDQDIFETEPLEIEKTKVLRTVIGGKTVFLAAE